MGEHLSAAVLFHKTAPIQHRHVFTPAVGHGQVMGDEQEGASQLFAEIAQHRHHLPCYRNIEAGGGFVGDDQRWREGNGQRDG